MPTASPGPWLDEAIRRGLIDPTALARPVSNAGALPTATRGVSPLLDPPAEDCAEKVFQAKVKQLAEAHGWLFFHPFDSRKSAPGYPDCTLVRGSSLIFAELKTTTGTFTPEQRMWLAALEAVPGVKVFRWRPGDWPEVVATLTREGPTGAHAA